MYKIWKYFEKGQMMACDYYTQQTARKGPAYSSPKLFWKTKCTLCLHHLYLQEIEKWVKVYLWSTKPLKQTYFKIKIHFSMHDILNFHELILKY